jgi:hypothetical protein
MGMIAILVDVSTGMARRRRQRLALAELMHMAPRRRDELGIDLVDLFEARIGVRRGVYGRHHSSHSTKGAAMAACSFSFQFSRKIGIMEP